MSAHPHSGWTLNGGKRHGHPCGVGNAAHFTPGRLAVHERKGDGPYLQGALDGLCAVYSIVNAARVISDTGEDESKGLSKHILAYLENREDLGRVLTEGIGLNTVGSILRHIAHSAIHERNMPFKHRPETSLDEFWPEMMSFLDDGGRRAVLIGLGGRMWDHGSIVHAISDRQIYFFDSYKLKSLKKSRCTTIRPAAARPHLLCPTHIYFLS